PTGWKLVPIEMVDEMRKAWFAELERWGTRRNKGEKLPYEVYRHSCDEVVSPVVMERFSVEGDAERCQFRLETAAAYRAMLAAAPSPPLASPTPWGARDDPDTAIKCGFIPAGFELDCAYVPSGMDCHPNSPH